MAVNKNSTRCRIRLSRQECIELSFVVYYAWSVSELLCSNIICITFSRHQRSRPQFMRALKFMTGRGGLSIRRGVELGHYGSEENVRWKSKNGSTKKWKSNLELSLIGF